MISVMLTLAFCLSIPYAELLSYLKGAKSGIQTKVFWTIVTTIGSVAVSLGMIIINIITE